MKPRYKHDCDSCQFLATIYYPAPHYNSDAADGKASVYHVHKHADLYFCKCDGGTVIARFSSKGSDYASRPMFIRAEDGSARDSNGVCGWSTAGPALATAALYAKVMGLYKGE